MRYSPHSQVIVLFLGWIKYKYNTHSRFTCRQRAFSTPLVGVTLICVQSYKESRIESSMRRGW